MVSSAEPLLPVSVARCSSRNVRLIAYRWWPSAMTTSFELTACEIAATRAGSVTRSIVCVTPSVVTVPSNSPGARNNSVSPAVSDKPHTGDKFVMVARVKSSRSVLAFGVVRSWGNTPPAPSSTTSSAPMTPKVVRSVPASSRKVMR